MSAARPRRSGAPASYKLPPLDPDEDNDSSSEEDPLPQHRRAKSESGSDAYAPDLDPRGQERRESTEEEDNIVIESSGEDSPGAGEPEPEAGDTEANETGDQNSAGSGIDEKRKKGQGGARRGEPKVHKTIVRRRIIKDVPIKAGAKAGPTHKSKYRTLPLSMGYHPLFEPPARLFERKASQQWGSRIVYQDKTPILLRIATEKAWSELILGPEMWACQDLGWWKGKWRIDGETGAINSRWGGWYDQIKLKKLKTIKAAAIEPYLPRQIYPSKPSKLFLEKRPLGSDEEAEDEAATGGPEVNESSVKVWLGSTAADDEQELVVMERFESRRLDSYLEGKPGYIFNAGGPISGTSWAPRRDTEVGHTPGFEYAAISTIGTHPLDNIRVSSPTLIQIWSLDTSVPTDLNYPTSTTEQGEGLKLELGLCLDCGDAWDVQWCPKGGLIEQDSMEEDEGNLLGVLAGAFTDGSISLFAVPHPAMLRAQSKAKAGSTMFVQLDPILKLEIEDSRVLAMAWGSHEIIAGGCMNGNVAIWKVGDALCSGAATVRPIQYFTVGQGAIRTIGFIRTPPIGAQGNGEVDPDLDPVAVCTTGYDGGSYYIDLRDSGIPITLAVGRTVGSTMAFHPWSGAMLLDGSENKVRAFMVKPEAFASAVQICEQRGLIWDIAASDHHPFCASVSADGTCTLSNVTRVTAKLKGLIHYSRKLFRIDFHRINGEYRMLDNIGVEQRSHKDARRAVKPGSLPLEIPSTVAAWTPHIAVTKANWHPSLRLAPMLLTGSASGLGRIDWCEGKSVTRAKKKGRGKGKKVLEEEARKAQAGTSEAPMEVGIPAEEQ